MCAQMISGREECPEVAVAMVLVKWEIRLEMDEKGGQTLGAGEAGSDRVFCLNQSKTVVFIEFFLIVNNSRINVNMLSS